MRRAARDETDLVEGDVAFREPDDRVARIGLWRG